MSLISGKVAVPVCTVSRSQPRWVSLASLRCQHIALIADSQGVRGAHHSPGIIMLVPTFWPHSEHFESVTDGMPDLSRTKWTGSQLLCHPLYHCTTNPRQGLGASSVHANLVTLHPEMRAQLFAACNHGGGVMWGRYDLVLAQRSIPSIGTEWVGLDLIQSVV